MVGIKRLRLAIGVVLAVMGSKPSVVVDNTQNAAIRSVLTRYVSNPDPVISATPEDGEDELMLYQDQDLSIWRCCFQPHVTMPAIK